MAAGPRTAASTAILQAGESLATLRCKQASAALPPGVTPGQCAVKSPLHERRMGLASVREAAGAAAGRGADSARAGAGGGGADAAGAAAGAGAAAVGMVALTAIRQDGDSLAMLRCRHCKASRPPGFTPEQFATKSDRHEPRIALACAGEGCACAVPSARAGSRQTVAAKQFNFLAVPYILPALRLSLLALLPEYLMKR